MPRQVYGYRKQILLFFLTVILPSLVLITLTLRIIKQDRELAQNRAADEYIRLVGEIGQNLLDHLENIKLQELNSYFDQNPPVLPQGNIYPEVIFIGDIDENRLVLPWEQLPELKESVRFLTAANFIRRIRQAEREEFVSKNYGSAVDIYRQCIKSFKEHIQKQYAQLGLARALGKSSGRVDSLAEYKSLLDSSPSSIDEFGIPFSLWAAKAISDFPEETEAIIHTIGQELENREWLTPEAAYFIRDLIVSLEQSQPLESVSETVEKIRSVNANYITVIEQAAEMQKDFPSLGLDPRQRNLNRLNQPLWSAYGADHWLISAIPFAGDKSYLVVLDASKTLTTFKSKSTFSFSPLVDFNFVAALQEGESLGPNFQNLRIVFASNIEDILTDQSSLQRNLYLLLLLLVLGIAFFGGYLLWRDVRREVRIADMRSQFVSSVSHELKTPLTAIRMFAETLRLGRSKDKQTQEDYLDTIVNESERLTRLLNNVLDFSKIEKGKRTYHKGFTSLSEVVQAAADTMAYPLSQQGFKLKIEIKKNIPEVHADKDALEQAILNLLSNAMKYSGDSREVDLFLLREENEAIIQVIDRGVGIAPEEHKHIFNKFYRISSPENERTAGTGLGLALVAHIVEAHGGKIRIVSSPGQGSSFSIYLPLEIKE